MPILDVDGRQVRYEDVGRGPLVMLLHGSFANAKAWNRVAEQLADRFRVIAVDLPGYGGTTAQPASDEPDVGFASELIEALICSLGPPTVLAGHSYGGVVALSVALRARVAIGALALFEPVAVSALRLADEIRAYETAKETLFGYADRFEAGDTQSVRTVIDFWFGDGVYERMPASVVASLPKGATANIRDVRAAFREDHDESAFRAARIPVDVVVGRRSPAVMHTVARSLGTLMPAASVTTIEDADHMMLSAAPQVVAESIAAAAKRIG